MSNMQKIGTHKTTVRTENNNTIVRYHNTDVVTFSDKVVYLNNNGYMTNTTKTRINQTANEYGLGFKVYQKNYTWFVEIFADYLNPVTLKFHSDDIGFYNPQGFYSDANRLIELDDRLNPKDFLALLKA